MIHARLYILSGVMKKFILCLVVVVVLSGCSGSRGHDIVDATKTETIILSKAPEQGPIHSLSVTGSGTILGDAKLILVLSQGAYMTEKLSGEVAFHWRGDWYSDHLENIQEP